MNKERIVWYRDAPPFIGWWNASSNFNPNTWRWWNGTVWSAAVFEDTQLHLVERLAAMPYSIPNEQIRWTERWPEGARVPRVAP